MTNTPAPDARRRYRPVSLEDLRSLTRREHEARAVIARVQALIDWRESPAAQLDPATDLPAGNWRRDHADNDFRDAVRLLAGRFAHRQRTPVPDVVPFEGATWICANRPVESLIAPAPAPGSPLSALHILGDRFQSRPLHELPARVARTICRSVGV